MIGRKFREFFFLHASMQDWFLGPLSNVNLWQSNCIRIKFTENYTGNTNIHTKHCKIMKIRPFSNQLFSPAAHKKSVLLSAGVLIGDPGPDESQQFHSLSAMLPHRRKIKKAFSQSQKNIKRRLVESSLSLILWRKFSHWNRWQKSASLISFPPVQEKVIKNSGCRLLPVIVTSSFSVTWLRTPPKPITPSQLESPGVCRPGEIFTKSVIAVVAGLRDCQSHPPRLMALLTQRSQALITTLTNLKNNMMTLLPVIWLAGVCGECTQMPPWLLQQLALSGVKKTNLHLTAIHKVALCISRNNDIRQNEENFKDNPLFRVKICKSACCLPNTKVFYSCFLWQSTSPCLIMVPAGPVKVMELLDNFKRRDNSNWNAGFCAPSSNEQSNIFQTSSSSWRQLFFENFLWLPTFGGNFGKEKTNEIIVNDEWTLLPVCLRMRFKGGWRSRDREVVTTNNLAECQIGKSKFFSSCRELAGKTWCIFKEPERCSQLGEMYRFTIHQNTVWAHLDLNQHCGSWLDDSPSHFQIRFWFFDRQPFRKFFVPTPCLATFCNFVIMVVICDRNQLKSLDHESAIESCVQFDGWPLWTNSAKNKCQQQKTMAKILKTTNCFNDYLDTFLKDLKIGHKPFQICIKGHVHINVQIFN